MKTKIIFLSLIILILQTSSLFAEKSYHNGYLENETLTGNNIFSGTIRIKGRVTVQEGGSLTIEEGTKLIFLYIDEDNDGIGESEILSQGQIVVKGNKGNPVYFLSDVKKQGAWLGFSIMNVDTENIIENAVFEDSYMALHSHFSKLTVSDSVFRNNYRGFQSQEGEITLINNKFYNNNTGVQFRNSKSHLRDNKIFNNYGGLNFLYSTVTMEDNIIENNILFGIKIRFSQAYIKGAFVSGSMQNIYGKNSDVSILKVVSSSSLLRGFSFENSRIKIYEGEASHNLLDGISLDSSTLDCDKLTLTNNGRFHIYLKGNAALTGDYESDRDKNVVFKEQ